MKAPITELKIRPSFSRIRTFVECQRRYLFDALFPPESTDAQAHGHAVHEAIAAKLQDGTTPSRELGHQVGLAEGALNQLQATPKRMEFWIRSPVVGRVDVLADTPGGELVIDWKTCGTLRNAMSAWETRKSLQLQIYSLATGARRAAFVYLPADGPFLVREAVFTPEQLALTRKRVRLLWAAMQDVWRRTGGTLQGPTVHLPEELDLDSLSIADPGNFFCAPKWCPHWNRCLGATE